MATSLVSLTVGFPWTLYGWPKEKLKYMIFSRPGGQFNNFLRRCELRCTVILRLIRKNERSNNKMIMTSPHLTLKVFFFPKWWCSVCCKSVCDKRLTLNDPYSLSSVVRSVERSDDILYYMLLYVWMRACVSRKKGSRSLTPPKRSHTLIIEPTPWCVAPIY